MFGLFIIVVCVILIFFLIDLLLHPSREIDRQMQEHPLRGVPIDIGDYDENDSEDGWIQM